MIINMPASRVKRTAKRLRIILFAHGIKLTQGRGRDLAARLYGFDGWRHFLESDRRKPNSSFDEDLSETAFFERDAFQMNVLETSGLGAIARELLDRVDPTGSWAKAQAAKGQPIQP